jgi:hypothetical protein
VVGVTGLADRGDHDLLGLAGLDELVAGRAELLHRRRLLGRQRRVADEGEVLGGVGHAVDLPVELGRLDGLRHERGLHVLGHLDRGDRAVLHQLAQPVVRADDDVRALVDVGRVLELLADVRGHLHLHGDAVLVTELLGILGQDRGAHVVGPDDQLRVRVAHGRLRGVGGLFPGHLGLLCDVPGLLGAVTVVGLLGSVVGRLLGYVVGWLLGYVAGLLGRRVLGVATARAQQQGRDGSLKRPRFDAAPV